MAEFPLDQVEEARSMPVGQTVSLEPANTQTVTLRPFGPHDLEACHGLSRAVSWPHRLDDWRLMTSLGDGMVAVDPAGTVHGVAFLWPMGEDFATLGLVIVSPLLQKSGIGRRLMTTLMTNAGRRTVQLNATADGLRLYQSFGFGEVGGIHQHQGALSPGAEAIRGDAVVRPLTADDHAALLGFDRQATDLDRSNMLAALLPLSEGFVAERQGRFTGSLLMRDFGRGKLLGPLVAEDEAAALALLSTAAVRIGGFLRADIPEDAERLAGWLDAAGLPRVSQVRTMLRGTPPRRIGTGHVFGLASQALG